MKRVHLFVAAFAVAATTGLAEEAPAGVSPGLHPNPRPISLKGSAPAGAVVTVDGHDFPVDARGRWSGTLPVVLGADGGARKELCLSDATRRLCTTLGLTAHDTLELAPLAFPESEVAQDSETVETAGSDGAGIAGTDGPPAPPAPGTLAGGAAAPATVDDGKASAARTVRVRARRRPVQASGQSRVTAAAIKRMPGLAEPDVIRAAQALPGVVASSDFSTKLYVRGSGSDQNLVLFDGAVLYSPMHFGGLFSTFLADAVGGMDFYRGGFGARYGGRLSSVLNVDSKRGGDTDTGAARETWAQGTARVTTLSGSIAADGRQGDFSWALAGRRTWIDQALAAGRAAGVTDLELPYFFYDGQGSAAWGHGGDTVRVSFYKGRDELNLDPFNLDWGNTAVPVNVKFRLTDRLSYAGTASYARFDQHWAFSDVFRITDEVEDWGLRQELNYQAGGGHRLTVGGEANRYEALLRMQNPIYALDMVDRMSAELYAGYLADRWVINPRHTLEAGVRGYYYRRLDRTDWDPRATYTYRPNRDWRLDLHGGVYHQYLTSIRWTDQETLNEFWYPAARSIRPSTSNMVSAGVHRSHLGRLDFRVGLEAFYKDLHDLPLYFPNRTQGEIEDQETSGLDYRLSDDFTTQQGYSAGVELTVGRDEGAITGEASWAVAQAVLRQDKFENDLGEFEFNAYPADWDQRNTVKASLNLNWRGRDGQALWTSTKAGRYLRTTLQANYHTGLPYTAFEGYYDMHEPQQGPDGGNGSGPPAFLNDNRYVRQGRHNAAIRPDYFRLDATVIDWGREGRWRLYWTLLNLTGQKNILSVNYDTGENPPKKVESEQIPFLPILVGYEYHL